MYISLIFESIFGPHPFTLTPLFYLTRKTIYQKDLGVFTEFKEELSAWGLGREGARLVLEGLAAGLHGSFCAIQRIRSLCISLLTILNPSSQVV